MEKTYISTQKYLITSPRKLRLVVEMVKKLAPVVAIEKMPFIAKRASEPLMKVIKSAVANARNLGVSDLDLIFKEIQIGEGPRLKRGRAASRGRWHPYAKRMSHIRVVLTTKSKSKTLNSKKIENPKTESSKKEGKEAKS
ncbi:MAG: uL22 family ribosomal protein [bacterium]|nr:uL22 family ribosomal protein [bacterium]